ncbi:MAG: DUF5074 domain-containing protein [Candidatus Saccharimonadaceae bacterium]
MKKTINFIIILLSSAILFSCSYDDAFLKEEIDKIKTDLSALTKQASSLQTMVEALNGGKVITKVDKLADDKGYKITFNDGTTMDVINGMNAPEIGIQEFEGDYYWTKTTQGTIDFVLDKNNNKMLVSGKDGKTPALQIDAEGYWTVNGVRIQDGEDKPVKAQGDSFFKEVIESEDSVSFVMSNGTSIVMPKSGGTYLKFDNEANEPFFVFETGKGMVLKFKYANVHSLEVIAFPTGWKAFLHIPQKELEIVAPVNATYGVKEVILRGLDKNGMVFQAIAKVSVAGKVYGDPNGLFVLNEGNMTTESGSLLFITPDKQVLSHLYFSMNGRHLGNSAQDLFINNGKMYIISQNGGTTGTGSTSDSDGILIVANAETMQKISSYNAELSILNWPSHVAVLNDENVFIRDNKGVYLFNTTTKELNLITGTKSAAKNRMAVVDGKVFVISGKKIYVLEPNRLDVAHTIEMNATITGVLKSKDGNLWVSTTGKPNKIAKVSSSTYAVIKENAINVGSVGAGWGATPGITAQGDTLYYSNAGTTIYRHIFSTEESKMMINAATVVPNSNMTYNNIAVHPVTGKVYMLTIKGYGWDFLTNNISEFDFSGAEPQLSANYTDYTHFPAGIFFSADFK